MGNPQNSGRKTEVEKQAQTLNSPDPPVSASLGSMPSMHELHPPISEHDVSGYIHDMAVELKGLAETAKLSFLAYLLALVIEERAVHKRGGL